MDIWEFNLRHLRAIVKIAELGTMNAAAKAVNLTQPAITQALARLETQLDGQLFERRHDGMVTTPVAATLVPRFTAALDHIASPHVTMSRMRALIAIADSGSFLGAAEITGLSLPSLHRAVSDLALSLRRPLIERSGRMLRLTEAGAMWARAFRLARIELETGVAELQAMRGHEVRRIVIGAMPLSRARVLPAAISQFLRRRPEVHVSIVEGSRAELIDPLRNGLIDLTVGAMRDPLLEAEFVQQPLFHDLPAVIGRAGHPLAGRKAGLAELSAYRWITASPGAPLRNSWEAMFASQGLDLPSAPVESGSVMIIRQLLIDSDFLTLLSPDQVAVELEAGWLTRIADLPATLGRTIGVTTRASWKPTAVQTEFLADLAHAAAGYSSD